LTLGKKPVQLYCPECDSLDMYHSKPSRRFVLLSCLLLGFPLLFLKRKWKCRECGNQWKLTKYAKGYYNLGVDYDKQGKLDFAIAEYAEYKKATSIDPNFATTCYNLACVYSLKKENTLALESLEEAVALDWRFVENAKTDSSFDTLRESPEFVELINSYDLFCFE